MRTGREIRNAQNKEELMKRILGFGMEDEPVTKRITF